MRKLHVATCGPLAKYRRFDHAASRIVRPGIVISGLAWILLSATLALSARPLTIADGIESADFMVHHKDVDRGKLNLPSSPVFLSPSGNRYVLFVVNGNIMANRVELEILAGELSDLVSAMPKKIARLYASGLGPDKLGRRNTAILTVVRGVRGFRPVWLDEYHVAICWPDSHDVTQILKINIQNGESRFLTKGSRDVVNFSANSHDDIILRLRIDPELTRSGAYKQKGYALESPDAFAMLHGFVDSTGSGDIGGMQNQYFLISANQTELRPVSVRHGRTTHSYEFSPAIFSPNGFYAIVTATPASIPRNWSKYENKSFQRILALVPETIKQLFLLDLKGAEMRPLFPAPIYPAMHIGVWSPEGDKFLVGPTFAPLEDQAARNGSAFAVVDIVSGQFALLPVRADLVKSIQEARWVSQQHIVLQLDHNTEERYRFVDGEWQRVSTGPARIVQEMPTSPIILKLRQGLNVLPVLFATDHRTGQEKAVYELNSQFQSIIFGKVRYRDFKDSTGQEIRVRVAYPSGYMEGTRYPLVIQTHGPAPETQFSIYGKRGPQSGPGVESYVEQALAGHGIAVVTLPDSVPRDIFVSPQEPLYYQKLYEDVASSLICEGLVEATRVGLMGFSRTGWHVESALVRSNFPYAAAIASDHFNGSYLQALLSGWISREMTVTAGGEPFGLSLKAWLETAPAFAVERIRAPLLLQATGSDSMTFSLWETFSRLRYLKRPVELYTVPKAERGSHGLQNPMQLAAVQQRALDWWLFWLRGEEDHNPVKKRQYASWRMLREQYNDVLEQSRAPLLKWTATPVEAPQHDN